MSRTARTLHVEALDALLKGRMAELAVSRDWELLREVARLANEDAPAVLASTDPALFAAWRDAVTKYHLKGWGRMTPERVDAVRDRLRSARPMDATLDDFVGCLKKAGEPALPVEQLNRVARKSWAGEK